MNLRVALSQVRVLVKKNLITLRSNLLGSLVFCAVLPFIIGFLCSTGSNPASRADKFLPKRTKGLLKCSSRRDVPGRCMNIGYAPVTAQTTQFMQRLARENEGLQGEQLNIAADVVTDLSQVNGGYQIYGFANRDAAVDFFRQHQEVCTIDFILVFNDLALMPAKCDIDLLINQSKYVPIYELISRSAAPEGAVHPRVFKQKFPDVRGGGNQNSVLGTLIRFAAEAVLLMFGSFFINYSLLGRLMADRTNDLLNYLRMFGMTVSTYHAALYISEMLVVQTMAGCCFAGGLALGGSILMTSIGLSLWIVIWYLMSACMIGFTLLLTALVPNLIVANVLYALVPLACIFDFVCNTGSLIESDIPSFRPLRYICFLFPARIVFSIMFCVAFKVAGNISISVLLGSLVPQPVTLARLLDPMPEHHVLSFLFTMVNHMPIRPVGSDSPMKDTLDAPVALQLHPGLDLFLWLLMAILYPLLAAYFRDVLPWNEGRRKSPIFFLFPSFWMAKRMASSKNGSGASAISHALEDNPDEDVQAEQKHALDPPEDAFAMSHLSKAYYAAGMTGRSLLVRMFKISGHTALRDFSLVMKQDQCVALLGHNGAGKSTMLSIVTGKIDSDSGKIVLKRRLIDPDYIHEHLGVCPQFDMLITGMTVYEHLDLYVGLRGDNLYNHWDSLKQRIDAFRMAGALNRASEALSGGMKRRLSVLIATIGDPEIVLMDEPTTGMDPVNRRFVWKFLNEYKHGRQLLLTTHSMEEAEFLGDKIAILRQGRLVAVGTTSHLKDKYDIGYRLTLTTVTGFEEVAFRTVLGNLPTAQMDSVHAGCLRMCVPAAALSYMIAFLENIESFTSMNYMGEHIKIFTDWTFTQMTLEDVFYRLNANVYEKKEVDKFEALRAPAITPSPVPSVNATFPPAPMQLPPPGAAQGPAMGYPPQMYSTQAGYPPQGYSTQAGYPPPYGYGYPPQAGYPQTGYPPQSPPPQYQHGASPNPSQQSQQSSPDISPSQQPK